MMSTTTAFEQAVQVTTGTAVLEGDLVLPDGASGIVLFAHGSGSGRRSPRNRFVAERLRASGLGTLLLDLLTASEEAVDQYTAHLRFDVGLLADRLVGATAWLTEDARTAGLAVGYFGASTGAGAALVAATQCRARVAAVVSRGGRPDLAGEALRSVQSPTLLIVGGNDIPVIRLNEAAQALLGARTKQLVVVPGATHLFEEPGKLEQVAGLASGWFTRHLVRPARSISD